MMLPCMLDFNSDEDNRETGIFCAVIFLVHQSNKYAADGEMSR
jgi:hypothetical protein